jgi:hypothetical protein
MSIHWLYHFVERNYYSWILGSNQIHSIDHLVERECIHMLPSVDDSSTISFCSYLVTRDTDFSLLTHPLDRLVEYAKDLTHVKDDTYFAIVQKVKDFSLWTHQLYCLVKCDKEDLTHVQHKKDFSIVQRAKDFSLWNH